MNNLLISEPPLQVLPTLAVRVGLKEAIVLQQFHYWLQRSGNNRDGYKWVYNSYDEWHKQFPFFSKVTLRRTINSLEKQGYLVSGNYNKAGFDKTKWYRIDYQRMNKACDQNDHTRCSNCSHAGDQNEQTNTNRLPETTTETTKENSAAVAAPSSIESDFEEIWSAYPNKKGKKQAFNHYKAWRKKSAKHSNDYLFTQLKLYKQYIAQNKDWYRPMDGSTWFNGRFDDEYQVSTEPKHEGREYWTGG
ncbi:MULTISPECIES: replication protein [Levilactobacillus]|uniref:Replication protein n=1 Tax=Levilactobacillus tujiorum TaxID=2912243 RepID=A0ABX1LAX9_9LACO|nr:MULTISPECIES: replication protein [Levilactobacillus]NLR30245.1 replication protein [Levilactobacillus tujiorum]